MRERIYLADRETVLNLNKEIIRDVPVATGEIIDAGDSIFIGRDHKAYKNADFGLDPLLKNNSFIHYGVLLDQWVIGDRVFTLSKKGTYYPIDLHVYQVNQEKELILEYVQEGLIPITTNLTAASMDRAILSDDQVQLCYFENTSLTLLALNFARDSSGSVVDVDISPFYVMTEQLGSFRMEKVDDSSFLLLHCPSTFPSSQRRAHIRYCSWVDGELDIGEYSNCFGETYIRESPLILHPLSADKYVVASGSYKAPYRILLNVVDLTTREITTGTHLEHEVGDTTPYLRSDHSFEGDKLCITYFIGGTGYATAYKVEGFSITTKNTLSNFGYNHVSPSSKYSKYNRNIKLAENAFVFFSDWGSVDNYYDGFWAFKFSEDNVEQTSNANFYRAKGSHGALSRFTDNSILWCKDSVSGNHKHIILTKAWIDEDEIKTENIADYTYADADNFKCSSNFESDYIEGIGFLSRINYNYKERQSSSYGSYTRNCLGIIGEDDDNFATGPDLIGERVKLLKWGDKILLVYAGVLTHYIEGILFKLEDARWVQEKHIRFPGNQKVCRHFDAILLNNHALVVAYTSNWAVGSIVNEYVVHTAFDIEDINNIDIIDSQSSSGLYTQITGNKLNVHRISEENYVLAYVGPQADKNVLFYCVYQLKNGEIGLLNNSLINYSNSLNSFDCVKSQTRFLIKATYYYSQQTTYSYSEFDPNTNSFISIDAPKGSATDLITGHGSLYNSIYLYSGDILARTYLFNIENKLSDTVSQPKYYDKYLVVKYYNALDYSLLSEEHYPLKLPHPILNGLDVFTLPVTETSFLKIVKNGGVYKGFLVSFDVENISSRVDALELSNNVVEEFTNALVSVDNNYSILLLASKNANIDTYAYSGILAKHAIVLNRKVNRPLGIALCGGVEGTVDIITKGAIEYTGLLPGADYYVGSDGRPALTPNDYS